MRILVCGCRDWSEPQEIMRVMAGYGNGNILIAGGAKGADIQAEGTAYALGWKLDLYSADWAKYGRSAGPRRNQRMLIEGKPEVVLAFWDGESRGTLDMIKRAVKAGVPVSVTPRTGGAQ